MKNIFYTLALMVMMHTSSFAGEFSTTVIDQRIGTNGSILHADPAQQSEVFVPLPYGFYGDLWISTPWNGESKNIEADYTAGWTDGIINAGISYYDLSKLMDSDGDILNPYFSISTKFVVTEKHTVTPSIKIEFPVLLDNFSVTGTFMHIGLMHECKVNEKISVTQNLRMLYDSGAYEMEKGFIGKYTLSVDATLTKNLCLGGSILFVKPLTVSDRYNSITPGAGITMKF